MVQFQAGLARIRSRSSVPDCDAYSIRIPAILTIAVRVGAAGGQRGHGGEDEVAGAETSKTLLFLTLDDGEGERMHAAVSRSMP
jgi:hypothetical protein